MIKKIHVGNLGECVITKNKNAILAYYVLEEDGTKSWQLLPNENSDIILKSIRVIPIEKDIIEELDKRGNGLYSLVKKYKLEKYLI